MTSLLSLPAIVPRPQHSLARGGFQVGVTRSDGMVASLSLAGTPLPQARVSRNSGQTPMYGREYSMLTSRATRDAISAVDAAVANFLDAPAAVSDAAAGARLIGSMLTFKTVEDSQQASRGTYHKLVDGHEPSLAIRDALLTLDKLHDRLVDPRPPG